jgi:hypothetical protein
LFSNDSRRDQFFEEEKRLKQTARDEAREEEWKLATTEEKRQIVERVCCFPFLSRSSLLT